MSQTIHVLRSAVAVALLIGCLSGGIGAGEVGNLHRNGVGEDGGWHRGDGAGHDRRHAHDDGCRTRHRCRGVESGGMAAAVKALKSKPNIGYIDVGKKRTPLKYVYQRPMSGGRLITVIASEPIAHLGAGLPEAKPKAGFDLALAVLDLKDAGAGSGELAPAATIKVSDTGALQTQDYGAEAVHLTNVQAKK